MPPMFDDPKRLTTIILKKIGTDENGRSVEQPSEQDVMTDNEFAMKAASDAIMRSIESKDPDVFRQALTDIVSMIMDEREQFESEEQE